jgi:hypothetical protein
MSVLELQAENGVIDEKRITNTYFYKFWYAQIIITYLNNEYRRTTF